MSYSRAMPNIKPYPQQDMHYQQKYSQKHQNNYSVYRPAYHRIPSTPAIIPSQQKDASSASLEMSTPIVVPSMSPFVDYHSHSHNSLSASYYQKQIIYHQPIIQSQSESIIPIHHTLENAIITYDTIEPDFQKDCLVKDVFFSPAMTTPVREMSPSVSSVGSCDEEDISSPESYTPAEFLLPDHEEILFDFGLDLTISQSTRSYEELMMASLPTPPLQSSKRRCSDSVLQEHLKKKQKWSSRQMRISRPTTPPLQMQTDYFDESETTSLNTDSELDQEESIQFWSSEEEHIVMKPKKTKKAKKAKKETARQEVCNLYDNVPQVPARATHYPTVYQKLTDANIDWCRYCGTTEGVNWRPGPWGKRTLCNKHGCDYKGYGFACKLPRLDLTGFLKESIHDRERPVLQLYCSGCQRKESWEGNVLVRCEGCPKAYHQKCCAQELDDDFVKSEAAFFCDETCCENSRRKRIVVELPRKRLPLMCAPKNNIPSENRIRSLRESSVSSTKSD